MVSAKWGDILGANLDELYREVILDHSQNPRRMGRLPEPTHSLGLHNPTCGDKIAVDLKVEDGRVADYRFSGHGCSISMASASMLGDAVVGRPVAQATEVARGFVNFLTNPQSPETPPGDLEALGGVRKFPARVKCATLAHNALMEALAAHGVRAQPH
jgi:nitrogen fixation NifU-like protein